MAEITRATLDELAAAFHARHEQTYGHANHSEAVQLVNLRLTALGRLPDLVLAQYGDSANARCEGVTFGLQKPDLRRRRSIGGMADADTHLIGPAIIEAMDSTAVVPPRMAGADR